MNRRPVIISILIVGIVAVSFASIFIKLIGSANPIVITLWRLVFSSMIIVPIGIAILGRRLVDIVLKHGKVLTLSGFFLSVHFFFWIASLAYTSVASSVVIVTTNPVWVGIGSYLIYREKITKSIMVGIGLTVIGGAIIGFGDFSVSPRTLFGDGLALCGAFIASGYLLVGKKARKSLSILEYITPVYTIAAAFALVFCLFLSLDLTGYTPRIFLLLLALAIVPQLIGHTTFNWALGVMPASLVAVAIVGEPVGSTVLAYFILGEKLTMAKMIGGGIIISGIMTSMWGGGRSEGENKSFFGGKI